MRTAKKERRTKAARVLRIRFWFERRLVMLR